MFFTAAVSCSYPMAAPESASKPSALPLGVQSPRRRPGGPGFSCLPPHGCWSSFPCFASLDSVAAFRCQIRTSHPRRRHPSPSPGALALSAPVTVRRDGHGVPHIDAATQQDMFVAQGYVTAQDRLWQMDVYRRNANGELAEVMGPSLLRHDKAQRMYQFRNTAHRIYANLPIEERARYEAYARGVNLYIAQHQDSLPLNSAFCTTSRSPGPAPTPSASA